MKPSALAPLVALMFCASVVVAAPPYPITTGAVSPKVTVTTAQNVDNLKALSNFFTQTVADYTLQLPGTTTLPATCAPPEFRIDTDATAACRLYLCTSTDTWTAQCGAGGGSGDVTGVGNCASGQCDSFTLTSTTEPLLTLNNNDTGTTTKTLFSIKRGGVASVVFLAGDDKGLFLKETDGTTSAFSLVFSPGDPTIYAGAEGSNDLDLYAGSGADVRLTQADGTIVTGGLTLVKSASPPYACDANHRGSLYYDTSDDEFCRCKGAGPAWASFGAGTCS